MIMTSNNEYSEIVSTKILAELLVAKGVRRAVLSPGSRNAPLVVSLSRRPELSCRVVIDERSAAFVALGMAQQSGEPVALVCTSGTALLNYAPAVAEAYYQRLPLIVISADRPEEWIDQDDSQTIRQRNALSPYVKASYQLPAVPVCDDERWYINRQVNEAINLSLSAPAGPVHINVPLREPLYATRLYTEQERVVSSVPVERTLSHDTVCELAQKISSARRVMILATFGAPDTTLTALLERVAALPQVVLLTETISNIPVANAIPTIDRVLSVMPGDYQAEYAPEILITFGGAPVSRMIKRYLRAHRPVEHWRIDESEHIIDTMQSLTRHIRLAPSRFFSALLPLLLPSDSDYGRSWQLLRSEAAECHTQYVAVAPWCDLTAFSILLPTIPQGAALQLSNGTSVRYAQLFETPRLFRSDGNRGTSGIDGSLSTAVGAAMASDRLTVCIIGDMSFLYDAGALAIRQLPPNLRIVVLCNGGGGIFRFIPGPSTLPELEPYFEIPQDVNVGGYASLHGIPCYHAADGDTLRDLLPQFFAPADTPVILAIETPRLLNAEILRDYFSRLNHR